MKRREGTLRRKGNDCGIETADIPDIVFSRDVGEEGNLPVGPACTVNRGGKQG